METFDSGAQRDNQDDKVKYHLIHEPFITRLAIHLTNGGIKYGDHNWKKGFPRERVVASLLRHTYALVRGDIDEDHASVVAFNAMVLSAGDYKEVPFSPSSSPLNDVGLEHGLSKTLNDELNDEKDWARFLKFGMGALDDDLQLGTAIWMFLDEFYMSTNGFTEDEILEAFPTTPADDVLDALQEEVDANRILYQEGKYFAGVPF